MSRNSRKLNRKTNSNSKNNPAPTPPTPPIPPPPSGSPPSMQNNNPFGLSFVVPTEDVQLPSKGRFYPKGSPLHQLEKVEIKHMTAREEDLLSTIKEDAENKNIFNTLINGILTNKNLNAEDMLEEDKIAILLRARVTGYGEEYKANIFCEKCNTVGKFSFDLNKSKVVESEGEVNYDEDSNSFMLSLPVSKIDVKIRSLNDNDLKSINEEKQKKEDLGLDFNMTISKLSRMVISAADVEDKQLITRLFEVLPAADAKTVLNYFDTVYPRISTVQDVECPNCAAHSEKEVPLSWAFFRTDF